MMFILLIIFLFIAAAMVGYKVAGREIPGWLVGWFAGIVVVTLITLVVVAATN